MHGSRAGSATSITTCTFTRSEAVFSPAERTNPALSPGTAPRAQGGNKTVPKLSPAVAYAATMVCGPSACPQVAPCGTIHDVCMPVGAPERACRNDGQAGRPGPRRAPADKRTASPRIATWLNAAWAPHSCASRSSVRGPTDRSTTFWLAATPTLARRGRPQAKTAGEDDAVTIRTILSADSGQSAKSDVCLRGSPNYQRRS